MATSTPRWCEGINDNCAWCGGSGQRELSPSPVPTRALARFPSRMQGGKPREGVLRVNRKDSTKLIRVRLSVAANPPSSTGGRSYKAERPKNKPDPSIEHRPCPVCGAHVRGDRVDRHVRRVHSAVGTVQSRQSKRAGPAHSKKQQSQPSTRRKVERTIHQPVEEEHAPGAELLLERRLDAARNYSAFRREHGSFGSHPTFDDHGEEGEV